MFQKYLKVFITKDNIVRNATYTIVGFQGRAVFTKRTFKKGELVVEYVGDFIDFAQAK
jgi:hypothetical protein